MIGTLYKGRQIDVGFEPCFNAFFDFYLTPKYIDPPLLRLEDVTFFLFLRKNLNHRNPKWKMPSVRQIKRRLGISQDKIEGMVDRLTNAQLLQKVSGYREEGVNVPNDYALSDPLSTLTEFLAAARSGAFGRPLNEGWEEYAGDGLGVPEIGTPPTQNGVGVPEIGTPHVPEIGTHKQTLIKQTREEYISLWSSVLETLRHQLPPTTFEGWIAPTHLLGIAGGTATIGLPNAKAQDWIENRLERQIRQLLTIETKTRITGIKVVIEETQ